MLDPEHLKFLPQLPGVYRMLDAKQRLLYVGKAKALKRRVCSYFQKQHSSLKTQLLVEKIAAVEITVTATEAEALILEQTLIKRHKPPYNILLKDDKTYPYIYLTTEQTYPRVSFYRGLLNKPGKFFGPFVSGSAVRDTLSLLQKVFKVRQCEDVFFRNRTRPCLQYQINRCTAPCVGLVSTDDYQQQVKHIQLFLEGRSVELIQHWVQQMEQAALQHDYEKAALYRDQISDLQQVQAQQHVSGGRGDVDVLAVALEAELACVNILHVRQGELVGQYHQIIGLCTEENVAAVLDAFVPQYYLRAAEQGALPKEIVLCAALDDMKAIAEALAQAATQQPQQRVRITASVRGERAAWLKLSQLNAEQQLQLRLAARANQQQRLTQLQEDLRLAMPPAWLECFDISHTQGEKTVASCVVFDHQGPVKSRYRRFNIEDITPGDDYAAIAQAVTRRYRPSTALAENPDSSTTDSRLADDAGAITALPDVIIIDGGKGQLQSAFQALETLNLQPTCLISIAKGPSRKPGLETLFGYATQAAKILEFDVRPASLTLLQQLRDEAHRFAITGHRGRRDKTRRTSSLENIAGIGAKRRKLLLTHFGGLQGLRQASVEDIARLPGIGAALAAEIVATLQVN
jgi:excinuclease ABC subunit C